MVIFDQGLQRWLGIHPLASQWEWVFQLQGTSFAKAQRPHGSLKYKINPESGLESLEFRVQRLSVSDFHQLTGSLSCLAHSPLSFTPAPAPNTRELFFSPSISGHWDSNFTASLWASDSFHERNIACASVYITLFNKTRPVQSEYFSYLLRFIPKDFWLFSSQVYHWRVKTCHHLRLLRNI